MGPSRKRAGSERTGRQELDLGSHQNFRNFHFLLAKGRLKAFYNTRIEIRAGAFHDNVARLKGGQAFPVGTVAD